MKKSTFDDVTSGQNQIDPEQLNAELQRAFDVIAKRIERSEALVLTHIHLHKLTMRAFLDLNLIQVEPLIAALETIRDERAHESAKEMMSGIIDSFKSSHGSEKTSEPHLHLVPSHHHASADENQNEED